MLSAAQAHRQNNETSTRRIATLWHSAASPWFSRSKSGLVLDDSALRRYLAQIRPSWIMMIVLQHCLNTLEIAVLYSLVACGFYLASLTKHHYTTLNAFLKGYVIET